jgi:hypothetical protein
MKTKGLEDKAIKRIAQFLSDHSPAVQELSTPSFESNEGSEDASWIKEDRAYAEEDFKKAETALSLLREIDGGYFSDFGIELLGRAALALRHFIENPNESYAKGI